MRRTLSVLAGAGLASAGALGPPPAGGGAPAPAAEAILLLGGSEGTATMTVLDEPAAPAPPSPPPPPAPSPAEWTVEAGESFWTIAEEVLAEARGRPPADDEVATYWRSLVDANRDRLLTGSPDLIRPGQVFVVPPVPSG